MNTQTTTKQAITYRVNRAYELDRNIDWMAKGGHRINGQRITYANAHQLLMDDAIRTLDGLCDDEMKGGIQCMPDTLTLVFIPYSDDYTIGWVNPDEADPVYVIATVHVRHSCELVDNSVVDGEEDWSYTIDPAAVHNILSRVPGRFGVIEA